MKFPVPAFFELCRRVQKQINEKRELKFMVEKNNEQHMQQDASPLTPAPSPSTSGVQWLLLDELHESAWNPRQYYPEVQMAELVQSMKESGFRDWLPLMVRPIPGQGYEIGAGHRRSRAAREAGLSKVPCIVREMTDEQFLDVLNFDNTGREDVHPLHEAAGWQQWMEKTGKGVLDIAARIGQSKEYVYQRLKYSSLIDEAKKAFLDGEIKSGHAILVARLQPPDQKTSLQYAVTADWQGNRPSVRQLAAFIQQKVHLDLARANFDLASAELVPAAGSCNACPKRTRNSPELLLGIEQVADPEQDDCTDPRCFQSKLNAHLVQLKAKIEATGSKPVEVSGQYSKPKKGVLSRSDYQIVEGSPKGSQVAVVTDGAEAGTVIHINVNPPKPAPPSGDSPSGQKLSPEAAKLDTEKRQAKLDLELCVRRAILDSIRAKVTSVSRIDLEVLLPEILHNSDYDGELSRMHGKEFDGYLGGEALQKVLGGLRDQEIFQLTVELPLLEELADWNIQRGKEPELLLAGAKRYKVDAAKIRIQVESAANKTPAAPSAPPADKKPLVVPPPTSKKAAPAKKKKTSAPKPAPKKKGKSTGK